MKYILTSILLTLATSSMAENYGHRMLSSTPGTISFNGDRVTLFHGDYKGDFSKSDCESSARRIARMFRNSGSTARKHVTNTRFQLARDHRYLVMGYVNNTEKKWNWFCVSVKSFGTCVITSKNPSTKSCKSGWRKYDRYINGTRIRFGVAETSGAGQHKVHYFFEKKD